MERVVTDTIDRITKLMDKHWDAKSITELTQEEYDESKFLLSRLQGLSVIERSARENCIELGITAKEVMIMNNFVDWFKSIGGIDED